MRVLTALVSLAACAMLSAQTLYIATGAWGATGVLYTVNPATAASTQVGNINVTISGTPFNVSIAGLAFHPTTNVLYGVTEFHSPNFPNWLVTIDPTSGAATLVGSGLGTKVTDISFSSGGTLYGWAIITDPNNNNNTTTDSDLATIDLSTGVASVKPTTYSYGTDVDSGGIGFDMGGVFYLSPQTSSEPLWIIDYTTNPNAPTVTQGPTLNVGSPFNYINALAYSSANSTLYGVNAYTLFLPTKCDLFTINPLTGNCAQILANHLPDNTHALAFSTTFTSWQKVKFTTAEQANSAVSGATAVYGQDGLPNLVKYALGLDPKTNITSGVPSISVVGGTDWALTYTRPSKLNDVSYSVEVSTDLVNWTTTGVTPELVSTTNFVDTRRGRYPLASATNAYLRLTIKLLSTTTVTVSNTTYTGAPIGGTASVSAGDVSQSLTVSYAGVSGTTYGPSATAPTNVGNYSASASYAGDTNHGSSSGSQNYAITQAPSTAAVTVSDAIYDGSPHGGTAVVTGAALSQSLTVTYTGVSGTVYAASTTAPTNVGSYSASASYAGDANHTASNVDTKNFAINKATSTVTVTASNATYDGSSHGGTATVTGPNLNQSLTVNYVGRAGTTYSLSTTPPTNAGSYTASASYAGDANHLSATGSADYVIAQVGSTTTVTVSDAAYDGNPHGGTASVTGLNLSQSVTVSYAGISGTTYGPSTTAPTNAGNYSATATFAGDTNHTSSSDSKNFQITQVSSTTTVMVSNAVYDNTPHGGSAAAMGLNLAQSVTVSYAGILGTTYGPSTTAPTDVGNYSASATFAGDTNHTGSSDSKNYQITQAASTTTVTVSDASWDGTPHGGSAAVTGPNLSQPATVTYSGISGTTYGPSTTAPTDVGNYSAAASFAGDANHTGSSDSKNFQITQATTTTTVTVSNATAGSFPGASAVVTGPNNLNQSLTVIYTGINGTVYDASSTPPQAAGDYSATATYAGDTNYAGSSDSKNFTLTP